MHGSRRLGIRAAITVLLVAALAPAAPATAAAAITFNHAAGDPCVLGTKPTGGTLTITLSAPNGTQRAKGKDTGGGSSWKVCLKVVPRPGDRLRAVRGTARRTITVPRVTGALDRVSDVLSGRAPAGRQLSIVAQHCSLSGDCDAAVLRTTTVNGDGRYRKDLTSAIDIRGADLAIVSYETSAGDVFGRYVQAPFVLASGGGRVSAMCAGNADRRVILRRADGSERARAELAGPQPCDRELFARLDGRFRRRGVAVRIGTGNIIRSDIASDARFTWPGMSLELVGGDFEGRCFANAGFTVAVLYIDGEQTALDRIVSGVTGPDGTFSASVKPGTEVGLDDRVRLVCETRRGDRGVLETRVELHP